MQARREVSIHGPPLGSAAERLELAIGDDDGDRPVVVLVADQALLAREVSLTGARHAQDAGNDLGIGDAHRGAAFGLGAHVNPPSDDRAGENSWRRRGDAAAVVLAPCDP